MACENRYADVNDFSTYWCTPVDEDDESWLNRYIQMAATNINVARMASGACDCTITSAAAEYLLQLNCVLAGVLYQCRCGPKLSVDEKRLYLEWAQTQLDMIRDGKLELCEGATGSEFPAATWAEQSVTEFAAARIIFNDTLRNG